MISKHRLLQLLSLKTLIELISYLEKNDIKYYILAGTLLGSIRHGGFIPWDTDIDIGIKRVDYNKLNKKKINDIVSVTNYEKIDKHYFFKRAVLNDTYIELSENNRKNEPIDLDSGIFVDIFPLDQYPSKVKSIDRLLNLFFKVLMKKKSFSNGRYYSFKFTNTLIGFSSFVFFFWLPNNFIDKLYNRFITRYNNCVYINNFNSKYGLDKQHFHSSIYGDGILYDFEGMKLNGPSNSEFYLKQIYGDYMKIPKKIITNEEFFSFYDVDFGKYSYLLECNEEEVYEILFK